MFSDNEQRIQDFILRAPQVSLGEFPDWLLTQLRCDGSGRPCPELVSTGLWFLILRENPGISLPEAKTIALGYRDATRFAATVSKLKAFAIACFLERLRREGLIQDLHIDDVFDCESVVVILLPDKTQAGPVEGRTRISGRLGSPPRFVLHFAEPL
jgi:hypothetical protein